MSHLYNLVVPKMSVKYFIIYIMSILTKAKITKLQLKKLTKLGTINKKEEKKNGPIHW